MNNVLPFKKSSLLGAIIVTFKYDVIEDGSVWYCYKLGKHWSEWRKVNEE